MNRGVPPTEWKARTGEFTPPGVTRCARANSSAETGASITGSSSQGRGDGILAAMADERIWYALLHTPGPAVPDGETVFQQPGFAEHAAFLQRRLAAGELIGAGPLLDADGAGMTVLAVASAEEA